MIMEFFESMAGWSPLLVLVVILLLSVFFVYRGIIAIKLGVAVVAVHPQFGAVEYTGKQSFGPAIAFIFIGSIFPLLFLSLALDLLFGTNFMMVPVFFIAVIVALYFMFKLSLSSHK